MRETHRIALNDRESLVLDWYPAEPGARVAVFVHGFASHRRGDKAVHFAQAFQARGWSFAAVDLRGHGESSGVLRDLTLSAMQQDLAAALEWIGSRAAASPPVLIGSSMGGAVIAWHASHHPRTVGPLVMIAPSLRFPHGIAEQMGEAERVEWQRRGVHRWRSEWIDQEIGFGLMQDAARYNPDDLERHLDARILILHGLRDDAVDWRASTAFIDACATPHVDLLLMKDGDHRLTARKSLLFDAVWSWLNEKEQ